MGNISDKIQTLDNKFVSQLFKDEIARSKNHKERTVERYWPTEASALANNMPIGACRRRVYYAHLNIKREEMTDKSLFYFDIGRLMEDWWRNKTKKKEVVYDNSVKIKYDNPVNKKICVSGEVDLIYKIDGKIVGGEIKSSAGYYFQNKVMHKKTIPGMPMVKHLLQVILYLYYYKHVDNELGIEEFIITYLDRAGGLRIHHHVKLDDDGAPIVNGIKMVNISNYKNKIYSVDKLNLAKTHDKLKDYEFNISSIFERYNDVYNHLEAGLLVRSDYIPIYNERDIQAKRSCGELSKSKYKDYLDGKIAFLCDRECMLCPFREKCVKDDKLL